MRLCFTTTEKRDQNVNDISASPESKVDKNRSYDGVEAETRMSQARFQII